VCPVRLRILVYATQLWSGRERRWGQDAIASYLGSGNTFDRVIADFAAAYADQNEKDYQGLVDAVHSGRVRAETGL
jgi:Uncharacterized protein conserved in bacteria (DUF2252)